MCIIRFLARPSGTLSPRIDDVYKTIQFGIVKSLVGKTNLRCLKANLIDLDSIFRIPTSSIHSKSSATALNHDLCIVRRFDGGL